MADLIDPNITGENFEVDFRAKLLTGITPLDAVVLPRVGVRLKTNKYVYEISHDSEGLLITGIVVERYSVRGEEYDSDACWIDLTPDQIERGIPARRLVQLARDQLSRNRRED